MDQHTPTPDTPTPGFDGLPFTVREVLSKSHKLTPEIIAAIIDVQKAVAQIYLDDQGQVEVARVAALQELGYSEEDLYDEMMRYEEARSEMVNSKLASLPQQLERIPGFMSYYQKWRNGELRSAPTFDEVYNLFHIYKSLQDLGHDMGEIDQRLSGMGLLKYRDEYIHPDGTFGLKDRPKLNRPTIVIPKPILTGQNKSDSYTLNIGKL